MNKQIIKREFKFLATQRSGHHAILEWIFSAFDIPKFKLNYCNQHSGVIGNGSRKLKFMAHENTIKCAIFNIENADLSTINNSKLFNNGFLFYLPYFSIMQSDTILVVRDIYNNMASAFASGFAIGYKEIIMERHKKYLRQLLNLKNYFTNIKNLHIINFNRWFKDHRYRAKIIGQLDINIDAGQFQMVPKEGHGSSFDGMGKNGSASEMKVLERYKKYLNNKRYINFFKNDKECVYLNKQVFEMNPLNL